VWFVIVVVVVVAVRDCLGACACVSVCVSVSVCSWLEFRVTDHDDLTSDEFMGSARLNLGVVCHCCCCCVYV
jgi:hypothetical protein